MSLWASFWGMFLYTHSQGTVTSHFGHEKNSVPLVVRCVAMTFHPFSRMGTSHFTVKIRM